VDRIRVAFADMPHMLTQIAAAVVDRQAEMRVVGVLDRRVSLSAAVARSGADVLIAGDGTSEEEIRALLRERPGMRVLAVQGVGRESSLWEQRPTHAPAGELSPDNLLAAIRGAPA
jgi:hypothetical protein